VNGDPFSEPGPSPAEEPSVEALTLQAEDALRRQVWETAIGAFKRALEKEPRSARLRLGLGRAYEGRGREKDGHPFLTLAVEQYRQAVQSEPGAAEAHEALIAASAKTGRLPEALAEYKRLLARAPGDERLKAGLRQIEVLTALGASQRSSAPRRRASRVFLEWSLGLAAVGGFLLSVLFKVQPHPTLHSLPAVCFRTGLFFAVLFFLHKLWTRP
jgi:tetratricopeptide (TPR) repeat protein